MTNDNCHFPPHTLSAKLFSKFIIIYNIYIIYNNDIIFIFSSSVPPQNMTLSFVIFVIFLCRLLPYLKNATLPHTLYSC